MMVGVKLFLNDTGEGDGEGDGWALSLPEYLKTRFESVTGPKTIGISFIPVSWASVFTLFEVTFHVPPTTEGFTTRRTSKVVYIA